MKILKRILLSFLSIILAVSGFGIQTVYAAKSTYFSKLTPEQKEAYRTIDNVLKTTNQTRKIPITVPVGYEDMLLSVEAFFADKPYYLSGSLEVMYQYDDNKTDIEINKINNKKMVKRIKRTARKPDLAGNDDLETLLNIHDYLINHVEYDYGPINENPKKFSVAGALLEGKAVCEGYARSFKYLCDIYRIPCILVTGTIRDESFGSDFNKHMWNYVKLNNEWYIVDVTWDDFETINPSDRYSYFLAGRKSRLRNNLMFSDTHKTDTTFFNFNVKDIKGFSYPKVSKTSYFNDENTYASLIEIGYLNPPRK